MNTQWVVFVVVLIINAVAAVALAILLRRISAAPGRTSLMWMLYGLAVWTFSYAMIALSPSLDAKHFWLKVENVGIVTVPILWFFFTVQYTRRDNWLSRPVMALFFIIPLITLVLLFSERWFSLYYSFTRPVSESGGPLTIGRGPWYWPQLIESYLLDLIGMGLLAWYAIQYRNIYRRQMIILLVAILIPLTVNIFYQLAPSILPALSIPIDLTPLSFTITAALISVGVFGLRLFDLIPIARHTVMEHIPEMVFVVDSQNRVLDANRVAEKWLGKSAEQIIGQSPLDVFRDWPELIKRYQVESNIREEIEIPGDPPRTLELIVSLLYDRFNNLQGRVVVAHDITEHKWLENDLKYANEALRKQLAEIELLRAQLQEQAIRDPLTNAFNRRYLAESLDKEISRAERDGTPVSVVILDMDNFKLFNDNYGHKCGDVILQFITHFLVEHARQGDVVCRYGGEEFVILMPNVPLDVGYKRAEMWRQAFSESAIDYEGIRFSATFSAGVASFPQHGSSGDAILQAADKALYQSKRMGRNRVTLYNNEQ